MSTGEIYDTCTNRKYINRIFADGFCTYGTACLAPEPRNCNICFAANVTWFGNLDFYHNYHMASNEST